MTKGTFLLCATFRIPADGLDSFRAYEVAVLPLLADHGGVLERRLRTADGLTEVHVIRFGSQAGFDAFRADRRRTAHAPLLERSGAAAEILAVKEA